MLIPLDRLYHKYDLDITGILHVGAHLAEEAIAYQNLGVTNVVWVEANHDLSIQLQPIVAKFNHRLVLAVVSDTDGQEVTFHITQDPQGTSMSSSILELERHKIHAPWVVEHAQRQLRTTTIDTLCRQYHINNCNFLNLDIQGAELLALTGAETFLETCDYVYSEVNTGYVYKNCALLDEIDAFLGHRGFSRVELELTRAEWGDAFFIRTDR